MKWRYGNTRVDLALVFVSLYISKRWKGKIQRGKEKILYFEQCKSKRKERSELQVYCF